MKTVLLIGNGAREHALAEALTRTGRVRLATYAKARNPGIVACSEIYETGSLSDHEAIVTFARKVAPAFAVIGPDDPIAEGVADLLLEQGIVSVAPLKTLARLESSKSFTRDLMKKYGIAGNPRYRVFTSPEGVREFMEELGGEFVVKADGLMGGKGVKVSGDHLASIDEGLAYARECLGDAGRVVVEEKLVGPEFSLMSFVEGTTVVDMMPVQDHKRAYENDEGPNTGGMGSYSDANQLLPFLSQEDLDAAHEMTVKVAEALLKETGKRYKGIMYGGFMVVKEGVRLIEYNARFGDPETMNVLPLLETDFVDICEAIVEERLSELPIVFKKKATVCKYLVPEGYPIEPKVGEKITVGELPQAGSKGELKLYYSSVDEREGQLYLSSSRAIAFVGIADTLEQAERLAESACGSVKGPIFFRHDVGTRQLIEKRVALVKELRGR